MICCSYTDVDLPKKPSEVGVIDHIFLDPSASHLIITTAFNENYYLHTQSRQPKSLSRLKGVPVRCVAWNPSRPTASTREILIGAADGNVYEVYIEPSTEFYRREEKYVKSTYRADNRPITGIWTEALSDATNTRRVLISTPDKLYHFMGKVGRNSSDSRAPVFTKYFESETPSIYEAPSSTIGMPSVLSISPDSENVTESDGQKWFTWLNGQGVLYGPLVSLLDLRKLGDNAFKQSKFLTYSQLPLGANVESRSKQLEFISDCALSQWHLILLIDGRIVAANILDSSIVFDEAIIPQGQKHVQLVADIIKNTYWLFTDQNIFEIIANDERKDLWKILLAQNQFDRASQFAKFSEEKNAVATASGDFLTSKGKFMEAAKVYGRSSKPFEDVALLFIDHGEHDALRRYLLTKLTTLDKKLVMQRTMVAIWLVEVFMAKLDSLDDTVSTKAELTASTNALEAQDELSNTRQEFQEFVSQYSRDLDFRTTYSIINSHGREEELLYFATVVNDSNYMIAYWVQRERWTEALDVLKKETDSEMFYKYSTDFMAYVPVDYVDILMRQEKIDARRLIPAFLNYNKLTRVSTGQVRSQF